MKISPRLSLVLLLLFSFVSAPAFAAQHKPVILDTDIGTDIDDTWALAYVLRLPELDLKLVVTDTGDTVYRAKIAAKELQAAGRTDVAVGVGVQVKGETLNTDQNLEPWVRHYDLAKYPGKVYQDGVGALIDFVMKSKEPVTIIAIGPVPNLAEALRREPRIASKCRFVGMDGSFDVGYDGHAPAAAESNVKVDPAGLRAVLSAPWQDILLTPLDTCGSVVLSGQEYGAIWKSVDDPLLRSVIESYCIFAPRVKWMDCDFFTQRSTTLFDAVAVYLVTSETLVNVKTVTFKITDEGFTVRAKDGIKARVALTWKDEKGFERELVKTLRRRP
jgi:inosine-uridine nucleoside N-ribohydrolase